MTAVLGRGFLTPSTSIYVAGHRGMVGRAVHARLVREGFSNVITRTSGELDLRCQEATHEFFEVERPEVVVLAAAKVGGILANDTYPADFLLDNLQIATNVISAAHEFGTKKLLNLGSSCIYPAEAPQPLTEAHLLTGPLESTNRAYAVAKIAAIELCDAYRRQHGDDFISAMPTNLYGRHDNFDLVGSHVVPALMRKMHEAKVTGAPSVVVWGSGTPRRELMHVEDLADACLFLLKNASRPGPINVGTGKDVSIRELAELIGKTVGFEGQIEFDTTKPDGVRRKLLDVSLLEGMGWRAAIELSDGLRDTYDWFTQNVDQVRGLSALSASGAD